MSTTTFASNVDDQIVVPPDVSLQRPLAVVDEVALLLLPVQFTIGRRVLVDLGHETTTTTT